MNGTNTVYAADTVAIRNFPHVTLLTNQALYTHFDLQM